MFGGRATLHVGIGARPGELVPMFDRYSVMFDRCWGVFRGKTSLKQPCLMPVKGFILAQIDCLPPVAVPLDACTALLRGCFGSIRHKVRCLRCRSVYERYVGGVVGRVGVGMSLRAPKAMAAWMRRICVGFERYVDQRGAVNLVGGRVIPSKY